jgi:VanZ family protein
MTRTRLAWLLWAGLLFWACVILWLSSLIPTELPNAAFLFWDKINHAAAYTVGGWLAASALRVSRPQSTDRFVLVSAVLLIAAFGVLDEGLQTLTLGRSGADVDDWLADLLGATVGALLAGLTRRRRPHDREQVMK